MGPLYRIWKLALFLGIICFIFDAHPLWSQRLVLPPSTLNQIPTDFSPTSPPAAEVVQLSGTQVLKTYPDGTKKIVPLEALNHSDEGSAFGGRPQLSLYQGPSPSLVVSNRNPERLTVAPIGVEGQSANLTASLPSSPDPLAGSTQVAAVDPMGGGASSPMGGVASAPIDPLSGTAPKMAPPPLQTVSGKPAPVVGDTTMAQLGEWESFFLNAGIGGSLQGQLTARRVWNGNNRQAYPYGPTPNAPFPYNGEYFGAGVKNESFTFQPGFRLDVEFGYNFYEWLGLGLQTGMTYNGINQYNVTFTNGDSYHNSADGELVQVPVQINGILRWPGQTKCRPFIGGGIGAIWQQLDVNNYYAGPFDVQGNYCRSAFQFGWNAQAGLTYTVEPGLDFYGAFKILSAFTPVIGNYQFENTYNFSIEVGIQSRF